MVWKRYRRHDGTHDLDTSEHDRRELSREPGSAMRWFRISSRISFGILGYCGVSEIAVTAAVPATTSGMDIWKNPPGYASYSKAVANRLALNTPPIDVADR